MTPKIVAFDIEATGLKADFAYLLTCAFGVVGEERVDILSLSQYGEKGENPLKHERALVKDVLAKFSEADVILSYYGKGYDIPFLNSKALEYGFPFVPPLPHIDLYFTAKSNLSLSRKSMQNVAYFLGAAHEKSPVEGKLWKAAMAGNRTALREIEKHNIADIEVLRDVYESLRPLVRMHPRMAGANLGVCHVCSSPKLQRRGIHLTTLQNPKQRVMCMSCASWGLRPLDSRSA